MELLLDPYVWAYVAVGAALGMFFGSLPGFTATMGVAILTPLTFWTTPERGMAMLFGLLSAAVFSGGIPAILVNTPGTPASIATTWDGYPLSRKGHTRFALGVNAVGSYAGQMVSILVLALASFPLARFALRFGPPEYFALAIFGISIMVSIASDSLVKGILMGMVGLALATVGLDPITGQPRFTFGVPNLLDGVSFIPVMVGLFGVGEVFIQIYDHRERAGAVGGSIEGVWPERFDVLPSAGHGLLGSAIGAVVGAIPGAGGDIGSIIAWEQSRRIGGRKESYREGSIRGLSAAATGANASIGGAMTTMLTLGIPGDSVSAVLIGALMVHGLDPGPVLFRDNPEFVQGVVVMLAMAATVTFVIGLLGVGPLSRVLRLRSEYLWGIVLILCLLGSYALGRSVVDMWVMLIAGVAGFLFRKTGFPVGPLVLALILGPMAEANLRRALVISGGDPTIFVDRPIALVLLGLTLLSLLLPLWGRLRAWIATAGGDATST